MNKAYLSGVYILYLNSEVMYVGQSMNIYSRLATHMRNAPFEFDSFVLEECGKEQRLAKEAELIHKLQPKWNRDIPAYLNKKFNRVGPHADA